MNERDVLKLLLFRTKADIALYEKHFERRDRPVELQNTINSLTFCAGYLETKLIELNEKEFPEQMSMQP